MHNPHHVIHHLLPARRELAYNIRQRHHDRQLSIIIADDSKLYHTITSHKDCKLLQDDLNSLSAWSKQWLMKFNEDKCVVLKIRASLDYTPCPEKNGPPKHVKITL